jgi:hypothetical protein
MDIYTQSNNETMKPATVCSTSTHPYMNNTYVHPYMNKYIDAYIHKYIHACIDTYTLTSYNYREVEYV